MTKRRSYNTADKAEAMELARRLGATAASEETGIPRGTIATWLHREEPREEPDPEAIREAEESGRLRAIAQVDQLRAKMIGMLDRTAARAIVQLHKLVEMPLGKDEWPSQRIRALVGAIDYMIKNAQLLEGEATDRSEARHEHSYKDDIKGRIDRLAAGVGSREVSEQSDRE